MGLFQTLAIGGGAATPTSDKAIKGSLLNDQALSARIASDPAFAQQWQQTVGQFQQSHPDHMGQLAKQFPQSFQAIPQQQPQAGQYSLGANVDPAMAAKWGALNPQQQAALYAFQNGQGQMLGGFGGIGNALMKQAAGKYGPISMTPGQPAAPMAPPSGQPMAGAPQQPQGYTLGTLAPPQPDPNDPNQQAQVGRSSYGGR